MDILKVSFAIQAITDQVNVVGNLMAPPSGLTIAALVAGNPQYWLEDDTNGNTHLCTCKRDGGALWGTFTTAGPSAYTLKAENFEIVELVGGRPIHRPHAY